MSWTPQTSRGHFRYGAGDWSKYYWNTNYNPNATFSLCLANCTTLCYGRALENGWSAPVTVIRNANQWHNYVNTPDWEVLNYSAGMQLKAGDIVEWSVNHVATIEEDGTDPYQSSSWYTGDDGSGSSNRTASGMGGSTLRAVDTFMINNYPYRFYHYTKLSTENQQAGGGAQPRYVIRYTRDTPTPPTPTGSLIPLFRRRRHTSIIKRR